MDPGEGASNGEAGVWVCFKGGKHRRLHLAPLGRQEEVDRGRVPELAGELAEQLDAAAGLADGAEGGAKILTPLGGIENVERLVPQIDDLSEQRVRLGGFRGGLGRGRQHRDRRTLYPRG